MADAPWRCSACGTINEPAANACRTCGRWPSLFELEASALEEAQAVPVRDDAPFEVEQFEPETFEVEEMHVESEGEEPAPSPADRRRKLLTSLIVPLAFAVYILISLFVGDRG